MRLKSLFHEGISYEVGDNVKYRNGVRTVQVNKDVTITIDEKALSRYCEMDFNKYYGLWEKPSLIDEDDPIEVIKVELIEIRKLLKRALKHG